MLKKSPCHSLGIGKLKPVEPFVISAFFVGMVGALHAYFVGSIFPAFAFDPLFDVALALMTFLGGLGTLSGPIIGALILEPAQQYFTMQFSTNGYYLIAYGALFLAIILLLPEGIVPTLSRSWRKRRAARVAIPSTPALDETNDRENLVPAEQASTKNGVAP